MFSPALKRGTGYWIGDKGAEMSVADFDDALVILRKMPTPKWRRPNSSGNWGIVAGVGWETIEVEPEDD